MSGDQDAVRSSDQPHQRRAVPVEHVGREAVGGGRVGPEQVVLLVGDRLAGTGRAGPPGRGEHPRRARRHDVVRGGQQGVRQRLRAGQRVLAGHRQHPGVDPPRVRQVLLADPGVGAVRPDQHVAGGRAAVGEVRGHPAVRGQLVADELAAVLDHVVQAAEQHAAQPDPAHRAVPGHRVGRVAGQQLGRDGDQRAQLLVAEGEHVAGAGVGDAGLERGPLRGGQAGVQGRAAGRVDVDAVALQPVVAGVPALVDPHVDARRPQPVGQAQPADAAADHQYPHRHVAPPSLGLSNSRLIVPYVHMTQ